jgi:hypothetical protein
VCVLYVGTGIYHLGNVMHIVVDVTGAVSSLQVWFRAKSIYWYFGIPMVRLYSGVLIQH